MNNIPGNKAFVKPKLPVWLKTMSSEQAFPVSWFLYFQSVDLLWFIVHDKIQVELSAT